MDQRILYYVADLVWASRLGAEARAAGLAHARTRDAAESARLVLRGGVVAVFVEIDSEGRRVIRAVKDACPQTPVIAFAPHVDRDAGATAEAAGADLVLSRGALAARVAGLMARLAGTPGPDAQV